MTSADATPGCPVREAFATALLADSPGRWRVRCERYNRRVHAVLIYLNNAAAQPPPRPADSRPGRNRPE